MATLNEMIAGIKKHGLARTNRFEVYIRFPQKMGLQIPLIQRIQNATEYAAIPGTALATNDVRTHGPTRKHPYGRGYGEMTLTIRIGEDLLERKVFGQWINLIVNPTTHRIGFYNDYIGEIKVIQLNTQNQPMAKFAIKEAYPLSINNLELYHGEENEYHKIGVQFAYKYYTDEYTQLDEYY